MNNIIILNSLSINNYNIEDIYLNKYDNVISYKYTPCKSELKLEINNNENNIEKEIFYIFDCPGEDALIHWIAESFIFYPIFLKLKCIYPNIKILTSNKKKYFKNIMTFFNINNDIYYKIDNTQNNICFFPKIISLNDLTAQDDIDFYKNYLNLFYININSILSNNHLNYNKILLLPRNNKDNYASNDRIIKGIDNIEENIIKIGGIVLNTYQINNINLQWSIINHSEIIILEYGSSFFFNCIFIKNKKIILLNNCENFYQISQFMSLKIMYDIINQNNKLYIINPRHDNSFYYEDIENLL